MDATAHRTLSNTPAPALSTTHLEAADGAPHPGPEAGGGVPHDELEGRDVPHGHHVPAHARPLLHHPGEAEPLGSVELQVRLDTISSAGDAK